MSSSILTMAQAKKDFERGLITGLTIKIHEKPTLHYTLLVKPTWTANTEFLPLVDLRNKEPRCFTTLDAALSAAQQIGFKPTALLLGI